MAPTLFLSLVAVYFCALLLIAWWTSRSATTSSYLVGNKNSPWYLLAFGLIGDSLSGVTFISVPGEVSRSQLTYFQLILGNFVGYWFIAKTLLPLYYRLNLVSIYGYLEKRFGPAAQKTGALFFLISRVAGAAARLYLAGSVLQEFVLKKFGIPFHLSVLATISLMLVYTWRGGIKTLVWTDCFQSLFLVGGLVVTVIAIVSDLGLFSVIDSLRASPPEMFVWDLWNPKFFPREFLAGIFLAIAMTGLDQNMMQKNLSCRTLQGAQTNIQVFSFIMLVVNLLFLFLGLLLFQFARTKGLQLPAQSDQVFPFLALNHLGSWVAAFFVLGLTAATFSSADSVLTTLTTSFTIDFLRLDLNREGGEKRGRRVLYLVHLGFAAILFLTILAIAAVNQQSVIRLILKMATYTYGPLLGLFLCGIWSKIQVPDRCVPWVCFSVPTTFLALEISGISTFGNELLILNAAATAGTLLVAGRMARTIAGKPA